MPQKNHGQKGRRAFVVSPYTINNEGSLSPVLPDVCPLHTTDGHTCKIKINHRRERKTGPSFSLFVILCREHNKGFTLYPPGYYPFSRHTLAPVAPDGCQLAERTDNHRFSGTIFDAALDAEAGLAWCQESSINSLTPRFTTQTRHLERAVQLFGIGSGNNAPQREEVAQIMMIPGQLLHDSTAALNDVSGIKAKGTAISTILNQIPVTATLFERLSEIGAGAGLWPTPLFCDPTRRSLHPTPFRAIRTRGSPNKNGADCCHNFIQ